MFARSVRWVLSGSIARRAMRRWPGWWGRAGRWGYFSMIRMKMSRTNCVPVGSFVAGAPLLQMVCDNGVAKPHHPIEHMSELVELGTQDSPEMIELTALTKPGPFGTSHP